MLCLVYLCIGHIDIELLTTSPGNHQSAAQYDDYVFFVSDRRNNIYMYNIRDKRNVYTIKLHKEEAKDYSGATLYHCNQTSFSTIFYEKNDPFPLLYVSQRANSDLRCFTEVYRIIPTKGDSTEYKSCKVDLIQTIYFPTMNDDNSLGNVNVVFDFENDAMYTYSRNNKKKASNYLQCKISCFNIPEIKRKDVYLEDQDINDSFIIDCSALYMQGACINNRKLYIAQGSAKDPVIRIIDLKKKKLKKTIYLKTYNYIFEPEGYFWYNGKLFLSSAKYIHQIEL